MSSFLDAVERAGNRLPHPTVLFVWFAGAVLLLSAALAAVGLSAVHPGSGDTITVVNLLSGDGVRRILTGTVTNFTTFAPLGTVLVAMLGIGVAEHSGLLGALLRRLTARAPARVLVPVVVFAGVLSSLAADAGYVVLIPLAAAIFRSAGRHPVAGITAAFAGVSGGFSANLLVTPLDAMLGGLSTSAAQLVDPAVTVTATANYYFLVASTVLITVLGTWVTTRIVEPRLDHRTIIGAAARVTADPDEHRAMRAAGITFAVFCAVLLAMTVPGGGWLRDPATGSLLQSPLLSGSVVLVALLGASCGIAYGRVTGNFRGERGVIDALEKTMATLAGYLVLMFFAAQFVAWFGWTNLGAILAIRGADALRALDIGALPLLLLFILLTASINLVIGSASAKWAILAPVFVPMLMLLGISPDATQMAFRVGDSVTNIITPLMPYLALVVAVAQQHDQRAGVGTLVAWMLPYSVVFLVGWSVLFAAWWLAGLPLGPGGTLRYAAGAG